MYLLGDCTAWADWIFGTPAYTTIVPAAEIGFAGRIVPVAGGTGPQHSNRMRPANRRIDRSEVASETNIIGCVGWANDWQHYALLQNLRRI